MTKYRVKTSVRERDGFRCTVCGMTNDEHKRKFRSCLHVHRLVQGEPYTLERCVTLCWPCHKLQPKDNRSLTSQPRHVPRPTNLTHVSIAIDVDNESQPLRTVASYAGLSATSYCRVLALLAIEGAFSRDLVMKKAEQIWLKSGRVGRIGLPTVQS